MASDEIQSNPVEQFLTCIACGSAPEISVSGREDVVCSRCGVTWRIGACLYALHEGLGVGGAFGKMEPDLSRVGIGVSDDWRLASLLASRFAYTNTFLHRFPYLDISDPPEILRDSLEFVICSDVLEHVMGDVQVAMRGLLSILRPGGFIVTSIPIAGPDHVEYFPGCRSYVELGSSVEWTDNLGIVRRNDAPIYHGGQGQTLTFRQFTEDSFAKALEQAGFANIRKPSRHPLTRPDADFSAGLLLAHRP